MDIVVKVSNSHAVKLTTIGSVLVTEKTVLQLTINRKHSKLLEADGYIQDYCNPLWKFF